MVLKAPRGPARRPCASCRTRTESLLRAGSPRAARLCGPGACGAPVYGSSEAGGLERLVAGDRRASERLLRPLLEYGAQAPERAARLALQPAARAQGFL